MSFSLVRILVPTAVGATVYITVKIFDSKTPSQKGFVSKTKTTGIKKIVKKITQDRALKFALISILATVGVQYFYQQIGTILLQEALNKESGKTGPLQVFVDLVEEHNIALHSKSIKSLISTPNHSRDEKVELLKIKLDFIINNELSTSTGFLIISIIVLLITTCTSGVMGVTIFLEALYKLLQEGRISQALYDKIVEAVTKNSNNSSY